MIRHQLPILGLMLLSLACKPGQEAATERRSGASYASSQNQESGLNDDAMLESVADVSVPVSGTNLTFSIDSSIDAADFDAYIVGRIEAYPLVRLGAQSYAIYGVSPGTQEIILTGRKISEPSESLGLRLSLQLPVDRSLDLGKLDLPKTGALEGLVEMEGISQFSDISLEFPGTKIPKAIPDALGRYRIQNLPVGTHSTAWNFGAVVKDSLSPAQIKSAQISGKSQRDLVYSQPNSPSNLRVQTSDNEVFLSWISGGTNPIGYLVYRGAAQDQFTPVSGQSYAVGKQGNGTIVAVGTQLSLRDSGLLSNQSYTYRVFAYNKHMIYSKPREASVTVSQAMAAYKRYRFHVLSAANNCQAQGTAQIQALNFYINKTWQINDFTSNTNTGTIGSYPVTVAVNSKYNNAYEAFYAFQDDNLAWSSAFKTYNASSPYDVLTNKNPEGIYFDINFGDKAVSIEGLEILGGEPPFFPECTPDSFYLSGSMDGQTWVTIPGSARQQDTQSRYRYYFQNENRPLSPLNVRLMANESQVNLQWTSASGTEIGYLLVRSRKPEVFQVVQGQSYVPGTVEGAYEILASSAQLNYVDTVFEDLKSPYYYSLFAYDTERNYSPAIVGRAVPEKRQSYRYYRFVVSSILGGGPSSSWVDRLQLQTNGTWETQYSFTGPQGLIGSRPVLLSESSSSSGSPSFGVFGAGYWQTAKASFANFGQADALLKTGEFIQMDFGQSPVALTGYRAFGNSTTDSNGRYSSAMYYQVPDAVRMERSQDGIRWEIIEASVSGHSLAQELELVW